MISIALSLLLSFTNNSFSQVSSLNTQIYQSFSSGVLGMTVKYPQDWIVDQYSGDRNTETGDLGYDTFGNFCPEKSADLSEYDNKYSCNNIPEITIGVYFLPPNITLEKFVNYTMGQYYLDQKDFKIHNINKTKFQGLDAIQLTYSFKTEEKISDSDLLSFDYEQIIPYIGQYMKMYVIKNGVGYSISYYANQLEFQDYLPVYNNMISSLKILDMPTCIFNSKQKLEFLPECELQ